MLSPFLIIILGKFSPKFALSFKESISGQRFTFGINFIRAATTVDTADFSCACNANLRTRNYSLKLLQNRIKAVEESITKIATSETTAPAQESSEVIKAGATKAACLLCRSSSHQLSECTIFQTGAQRASEFRRRQLCRRCSLPNCTLQSCPSPFVICQHCVAAGIREDRSLRHLDAVCDETKRAKAARRIQQPPERRPKRMTPAQKEGDKNRATGKPRKPVGREMPVCLTPQAPPGRQQLVYFLQPNHQQQYSQGMPIQMGQAVKHQPQQQMQMQFPPQRYQGAYGYQQ